MKNRSPIAVFFLSIITFGIYDIYWLVKTKKVLNEETNIHTPTIWMLVIPYVLLVGGYIYMFTSAGFSSTANTTTTNTNLNGSATNTITHPAHFLIGLGIVILGFIAVFVTGIIWFFSFSKAVNQYTKGKMSTAVSFLILWLIHFIGVALIQDTFNDMQEGGFNQPMPNGYAPQGPAQSFSQQQRVAQPPATHNPGGGDHNQPKPPLVHG